MQRNLLCSSGTFASQMCRFFAFSVVRTKQVTIGMVEARAGSIGASCCCSCLTVLPSVGITFVIRSAAITCVGGFTFFIQGFKTCSTVKTMSVATFDTWKFASIPKPAFRAGLMGIRIKSNHTIRCITSRCWQRILQNPP
jgi:hypothetical protein